MVAFFFLFFGFDFPPPFLYPRLYLASLSRPSQRRRNCAIFLFFCFFFAFKAQVSSDEQVLTLLPSGLAMEAPCDLQTRTEENFINKTPRYQEAALFVKTSFTLKKESDATGSAALVNDSTHNRCCAVDVTMSRIHSNVTRLVSGPNQRVSQPVCKLF